MSQPFISIIIAVYNGEQFIEQAIQSILNQDYPTLEVIVVDDGSTDNTASRVLSINDQRIKFIQQENRGQSAARNIGIQHANGSILGFLDADDVWSHHHIASLIPFLDGNSEFESVRGFSRFFRSTGTHTIIMAETFGLELVGSALYRKSLFDRVGLFDETMRRGEDLDWRIRFEEKGGKEKRIGEVVVFCRRHADNMTNSTTANTNGRIEAFRKKLARQRINTSHGF